MLKLYPEFKKGIFLYAFFCFILFSSHQAHATFRFFNLDPGKNVTLPDWTGSGDVLLNVDFCTISTQGNPQGPARPYALAAQNRAAGETNLAFRITNLADATQILPVSMTFSDQYGGGTTEILSPNVYTAQDKTGAQQGCPGGNNSRIELVIAAADLEAVAPGNYRGSFNIDGIGGSGGTQTKSTFFTLNLTIADTILITNLNDLIFPPFDMINNLVQSDDFCIYRNGAGTYQITPSGSGAGGAFEVTDGTNLLPYSATYDDGTGPVALTANTVLTTRQNVFTLNQDCDLGASNNAILELTFLIADLNAVPLGTYTGTITLLVAPE